MQGYIHGKERFTILQGKDIINGKVLINLFCKLTKIIPLFLLSVWLKIDCLLWLSMVWNSDGVVYFTIALWLLGFLNIGSKLKVGCLRILRQFSMPILCQSLHKKRGGGLIVSTPPMTRLHRRYSISQIDKCRLKSPKYQQKEQQFCHAFWTRMLKKFILVHELEKFTLACNFLILRSLFYSVIQLYKSVMITEKVPSVLNQCI